VLAPQPPKADVVAVLPALFAEKFRELLQRRERTSPGAPAWSTHGPYRFAQGFNRPLKALRRSVKDELVGRSR
jgi:hypothetical protein